MRLYEYARVIRSKNAGPFIITIDLFLEDRPTFDRVYTFLTRSVARIAELYRVPAGTIHIHPFEAILAVKVTFPRPFASSGSPGDCDVYGSQQHFPLANMCML